MRRNCVKFQNNFQKFSLLEREINFQQNAYNNFHHNLSSNLRVKSLWDFCVYQHVRLQRSAGFGNRKQYDGDVDHVTSRPRKREREREREHNDTGYHSLPRSTPVEARPAAAVENQTFTGNLNGRYSGVSRSPTRRQSLDNSTYVSRRNDVGNYRSSSSSRPSYRY